MIEKLTAIGKLLLRLVTWIARTIYHNVWMRIFVRSLSTVLGLQQNCMEYIVGIVLMLIIVAQSDISYITNSAALHRPTRTT